MLPIKTTKLYNIAYIRKKVAAVRTKWAETRKNLTASDKMPRYLLEGAVIGAVKNWSQYVVKTSGRRSNIVNVFVKSVRSSRGNPRWFARVDRPHKNVDFFHINVNEFITGVRDPHIEISESSSKAALALGQVLEAIQTVAPVLMVVYLIDTTGQIKQSVKKDVNHGSSRNTLKTVLTKTATVTGSVCGSYIGASLGTVVFPGVGTMVCALIGSTVCGGVVGVRSDRAVETRLEAIKYNVKQMRCNTCKAEFEWRRYEETRKEICPKCRNYMEE